MNGVPRYTASRCRKSDALYGKMHGSTDACFTLCGTFLTPDWMIVTTNFDGTITCRKCATQSLQIKAEAV